MRRFVLPLLIAIACGSAAPFAVAAASAPPPKSGLQCVVPTTGGAVRHFVVYDNTFYTNLDLETYGLIKSNVVYEPATMRATTNAGHLPAAAAFMRLVRQNDRNPGPVVLDFENLYLQGSPEIAAQHFRLLETLATWAHQAAPGKVIGFYGLLDHTDRHYLSLAKRLAPREDAFFPSLYTFNDDRAAWSKRVRDDVALAHSIAPRLPVYLYLWPQYHEHTAKALQYLDASYWSFQLRTASRYADGVVIWSGKAKNTSTGWVTVTASFMRACQKRA